MDLSTKYLGIQLRTPLLVAGDRPGGMEGLERRID